MPARWQLALGAHRLAHPAPAGRDHSRLMFAVCSESIASTELLAAFPTAYVLQTLGGLPRELDAVARSILEYGVLGNGVRHIVACGHHRCREPGGSRTPETSQARITARCRALQADEHIGPMLRRARVTLQALWLEDVSRDLYACDLDGLATRCMTDEDLAEMFTAFDEASA